MNHFGFGTSSRALTSGICGIRYTNEADSTLAVSARVRRIHVHDIRLPSPSNITVIIGTRNFLEQRTITVERTRRARVRLKVSGREVT